MVRAINDLHLLGEIIIDKSRGDYRGVILIAQADVSVTVNQFSAFRDTASQIMQS